MNECAPLPAPNNSGELLQVGRPALHHSYEDPTRQSTPDVDLHELTFVSQKLHSARLYAAAYAQF